MKKITLKKNLTDYISRIGIKLIFRSDAMRFDRNGLHHTGWDVITDNGTWGIYEGGELLN